MTDFCYRFNAYKYAFHKASNSRKSRKVNQEQIK